MCSICVLPNLHYHIYFLSPHLRAVENGLMAETMLTRDSLVADADDLISLQHLKGLSSGHQHRCLSPL